YLSPREVFFLFSAHRFFIASDRRFLPSAVRRRRFLGGGAGTLAAGDAFRGVGGKVLRTNNLYILDKCDKLFAWDRRNSEGGFARNTKRCGGCWTNGSGGSGLRRKRKRCRMAGCRWSRKPRACPGARSMRGCVS